MSYRAAIEQLARAYAGVDAQRAEATEWYARQVAAVERATREAAAAVAAATESVAGAQQLVERVDAEADEVWRTTIRRLGPVAARYGGTPPPAPAPQGEAYNPHQVLEGALRLIDDAWRPGRMSRQAYPLLVLLSAVGAGVAVGLREAALWLGREHGGDLAVGLPVLALVVTLVAPLVGLWPAKVVADRRHVALDPTTITVVVAAGLATTATLLLAF
ncbi:hypothetical protein [Phytohabitans rumicis]|uniref:Uncharacterized protein n=1 Tax=Phytohabitans rumicis TaxID=1076125 RepID=A0A6V8LKF0_9ACTN|nr:hypothetical protein [Phytohabitans rumicis]GFJ94547.1 hypothetical protein Prum_081890 [Phytohabitans rumicis]